MAASESVVKAKWMDIKGDVQKAWGRLTDEELEKTKGDFKAIGGLIQQKYGESQESYTKRLSEIFQRFEGQGDMPH